MTAIMPYIAAFVLALAIISGGLAWVRTQQLEAERKDNATLTSNFAACETGQDKLRESLQLIQQINADAEAEALAEIQRQEQAAAEAEVLLTQIAGDLTLLQGKLAEDPEYADWSEQETPEQVSETLK